MDCCQQINFIGKYRFFIEGRLVGESTNLITDQGKRHIFRFLAGQEKALAGSIALGVGTNAAVATDQNLTYEFERVKIFLTSPDYINKKIVFKGSLDEGVVGDIYEVGLYSNEVPISSKSLAVFKSDVELWSNGVFTVGSQRLGRDALRLSPAAGGTLTTKLVDINIDLSLYSDDDELSLAFFSTSNVSSVKVRLNSGSSYGEYVISSPGDGYKVVTFKMSALVRTGTFDLSRIDSVEVSVSSVTGGSGSVDLDGLRVKSVDTNFDDVLISHSILAAPVSKKFGVPMDIEYSLEVPI